jgi:DNA-binding LacI/PurR family transcriptional regulator
LVKLGVDALKQQGCRQLGFLKPWCTWEAAQAPLYSEDAKAFRDFLAAESLPYNPDLVWEARTLPLGDEYRRALTVPDTAQEQGYQALMSLFTGPYPRPDGLVILDDMMTRGALAAVRQLGLKLGKDLHIATHANKGSATLSDYRHELSLIEVDTSQLVNAMFASLEGLMAGHEPDEETVWINPEPVS